MTTTEIKQRLLSLQNEINQLVDHLPDTTQISFGTRFYTQPANVTKHKQLVLSIRETQPD